MTKFVGLRTKTCSYFIDDGKEDKNSKGTKKYTPKRKFKFESYKKCLEATWEYNMLYEKIKQLT